MPAKKKTCNRISLDTIQAAILANVRPELLDSHKSWVHLPLLRLWSARVGCVDYSRAEWGYLLSPAAFERKLLKHAQELLSPLSESSGCRAITRSNRWLNPGYCPPTPLGNYLWTITCWHVQSVIWMTREFVEGYDWWLSPDNRWRDANPYFGDRGQEWDTGYLLGLSEHHHPGRIQKWIDTLNPVEQEAEAARR